MDTSDPRHFGPKTVQHCNFGTEMSHFFVSVPKCLWDTSALTLNILWRGRSVQRTASRDILYIRNHTRTFTFDSLRLLRPREQFRWWLDLGVDSRSWLESTWRFRVESSRFYLLKSTSKSNSLTEVTSSRFCPKSTWKWLEAKFRQLSSRTVGLLLRFLEHLWLPIDVL